MSKENNQSSGIDDFEMHPHDDPHLARLMADAEAPHRDGAIKAEESARQRAFVATLKHGEASGDAILEEARVAKHYALRHAYEDAEAARADYERASQE